MNSDLSLISKMFVDFQAQYPDVDIMIDGFLDERKYRNAKVKLLWILKQEYYDSGALENSYSDRIKKSIVDETVAGSATWRRMSYVSYGLLSGERDFSEYPNANECAELVLATALIELSKELGASKSPNQVIADGFERYKDLIFLQIETFKPDVIIICLSDRLKSIVDSIYERCHGSDFIGGLPNVIIEGADVAIGKDRNPLFLWAYHPQSTKGADGKGITDESYTTALLGAYDKSKV